MSFGGTQVVARAEPTLFGVQALMECTEGLDGEWRYGPWRVGQLEPRELPAEPDVLVAIAAETGAPALTVFIPDDAVVVHGFGRRSGAWQACLAREAMRGHSQEVGEDFDTAFLAPAAATERAVAWAEEAGLPANPAALQELFRLERAERTADDLVPRLFAGLGLPERDGLGSLWGASPPLSVDALARRSPLDSFLLQEAAPVLKAAGFTR